MIIPVYIFVFAINKTDDNVQRISYSGTVVFR